MYLPWSQVALLRCANPSENSGAQPWAHIPAAVQPDKLGRTAPGRPCAVCLVVSGKVTVAWGGRPRSVESVPGLIPLKEQGAEAWSNDFTPPPARGSKVKIRKIKIKNGIVIITAAMITITRAGNCGGCGRYSARSQPSRLTFAAPLAHIAGNGRHCGHSPRRP